MNTHRLVGLIALPAVVGLSCVGSEEAPVAEEPPAVVAIRNATTPIEGILTGGQPTPAQIDEAAAAGFRTVINLRTAGEEGFEWEHEAVEAAGMRYVHLPIDSDRLTRANVELLDAALATGLTDGPVMLHCASGNRVGALLALRAGWLHGAAPKAALELGRAGGLTKMEPQVVELLTRE